MSKQSGSARRGRGWSFGLMGLAFAALLVLMALASAPLAGLTGDARAAQRSLVQAQQALEDGDLDAADSHAAEARESVASAQERTGGAGRSVLAAVPVFGSAVSDARHLVSALDHATTIAETGIEVYAPLSGKSDEQLFADGQFDLGVLNQVITGAERIGTEATAAEEAIEQVQGSAPLVGGRISQARDDAAQRIVPVAEGYRRAQPVIEALPQLLGADGQSSYLVALLNPGELRWSGGIPLAFTSATLENGQASFGETRDMRDISGRWVKRDFPPVRGNPFHTGQLPRLTFHPDWAVSGREQLEGWERTTGENLDTIVALDVPGIAELLRATGTITVPVYGKVTAGNLVELQAGSYDRIQDQDARKDLNKLLVEAVRERLLSGENALAVVRAMYRAAQERHLAVVSRDEDLDSAFVAAGMGGQLTEVPHDYLSAFSMSYGGSKAGYWEERSLTSQVELSADGSAEVSTTVRLLNDSPPYRGPGEDPRRGYFTRWTNLRLLQVLPQGATITAPGSIRAQQAEPSLGDRPWLRRDFQLPPNEPVERTLDYTVPQAASVDGDQLMYRLSYDPQGMVNPQALRVRLRFPAGYDADTLPDGWTRVDGGARLDAGAVETSETWTIALTRN